MPSAMRRFVLAVIAVAVFVVAWVVASFPTDRWVGLIILGLLGLVAANMTFDYPTSASVSLGFAFTFAAIVYSGPIGGALVGLAGAASIQEIRDRKPALMVLGNGAQLALAGAVAGMLHVWVSGWAPLLVSAALVRTVLAPAVAASGFFAVNVILVSIGIGFKTGMRPTEAMKALGLAQHWISLLVLALLGLVLAELLSQGSWLGAVLLVLPFTMARRTFRVYVELTEAYTSTVRSLVTAIEAKDPYTRGHSERVAEYACRLAERIGMPRAEIDLIERAALLHDVGKIGISLDTLVSPEKLTPDEVNAIRQHPALGSDLVGDVEFLSDIVDVVRHHHERCDGAGYPDGLVGDRISIPARILAIADAYDAMTSDRAYRPRMTDAQARDELHRVADSQLDGDLVRQFTAMLSEDRVEGSSA
jgi:putative nucleotidyltransferase with HDIG domain